jgi:hypothetical protein
VRYWLPAFACGAGGIAMPGIPGIDGAAAGAVIGMAIEHEQPPPQASASLVQQARPQQQLKTVDATNFNMTKLLTGRGLPANPHEGFQHAP